MTPADQAAYDAGVRAGENAPPLTPAQIEQVNALLTTGTAPDLRPAVADTA